MLVFQMEDEKGRGYPGTDYKNEAMITLSMARKHIINLNSPENVDEYYRLLFTESSSGEMDKKEIRQAIEEEDYEALSDAYHLIEQSNQDVVIVPYCMSLYDSLVQDLVQKNWCLTKDMMKAAQKIAVTVKLKEEMKLCCRQLMLKTRQGTELINWYLLEDHRQYHSDLGLVQELVSESAFFV